MTLTAGPRSFPIDGATLPSAAIGEDPPPAEGAVEDLRGIAIRACSAGVRGQARALALGPDVVGQHLEAHPQLTARLPAAAHAIGRVLEARPRELGQPDPL